MAGYNHDLAYIHDVGFTDTARRIAPTLLRFLRDRGIRRGRVVDLGCGSGVWAEHLVNAGYDVVGIDLSPAMIELARKRVPAGEFHVGSLHDARLPQCDAMTAMGECINYLFDGRKAAGVPTAFFRRAYAALRPSGVFVFDFATPGRLAGQTSLRGGFSGEDWAIVVEAREQARTLTRRITSFRRVDSGEYRRSDELHRLRLYTASEILLALRKVGFRARALKGYGSLRLPPGWIAVFAQK